MKAEGFFKNGDQWFGRDLSEDGKRYFVAVTPAGDEYETLEMPVRYPLFTMIRFQDGTGAESALRMLDGIRKS